MTISSNSSTSSSRVGNTILPSDTRKQVNNCKNWCFTWNNYTNEAFEMLNNLDSSIVPVIVYQEELGENNSVPHLQGFISFKNKSRWSTLKLPKEIHWEKARDAKAAKSYCIKDDTRKENGIRYIRGWDPLEEKIVDKFYHMLYKNFLELKYKDDISYSEYFKKLESTRTVNYESIEIEFVETYLNHLMYKHKTIKIISGKRKTDVIKSLHEYIGYNIWD